MANPYVVSVAWQYPKYSTLSLTVHKTKNSAARQAARQDFLWENQADWYRRHGSNAPLNKIIAQWVESTAEDLFCSQQLPREDNSFQHGKTIEIQRVRVEE